MAYARTDVDEIVARFEHSWMASADCVAALDSAAAARQSTLVGSTTRSPVSPFGVGDLVGLLRDAIGRLTEGPPAALGISLACALLAELLGTTHEQADGGVFKLAPATDKLRRQKQDPVRKLRNALCHPGNVGDRSHFEILVAAIEKERHRAGPVLRRTPVSGSSPAGSSLQPTFQAPA